jgi:hypothetical protein
MSLRRFLGRVARSRGRSPAVPSRPQSTPPAAAEASSAAGRDTPAGQGRPPLPDPWDEGPVLDEAELRALREELARELERVAQHEREATG